MNKIIPFSITLLILIFSISSVKSQLPRWAGVNQAYISGGSHASIREIAAGADGSIFVVGRYNGDLNFKGGTAGFGNSKDGFLAKVNADGTFAWGRGEGKRANDTETRTVFTDSESNVYVAGDFNYTAIIGGTTVTATGNFSDGYIVSYDPNGDKRWAKVLKGSGNVSPTTIRTDHDDNVVVCGYYEDDIILGTGQILTRTGAGQFMAGYSPTGTPLWKKDYGRAETPSDMKIGKDKSIYRVFYNYAGGDTVVLDGITALPQSKYNAYIVKSDSVGNAIWIKQIGTTSNTFSIGNLQLDALDNVFLTGSAKDTLIVGGNMIKTTSTEEGFILKFDNNGNLTDQLFIKNTISSMAGNGSNTFYVGGGFDGTLTLGSQSVTAVNGPNFYVAEMTNDLKFNWIKTGGEGGAGAVRVAYSSENFVATVGTFSTDIKIGDSTVLDLGINDFFTANLLIKELWTGVDNEVATIALQAYPNPFTKEIVFNLPSENFKGNLSIIDATGKLCFEKRIANSASAKYQVELSLLKPGIYYYSLISDSGNRFAAKLIKQ